MGATTSSRVKRGKTKYPAAGVFAASIGMTRAGVYKALEREDPIMWGKYAAFCERIDTARRNTVNDAKARVSNAMSVRASKLAEAENIALHDEYIRERYPEKMGDYFNS